MVIMLYFHCKIVNNYPGPNPPNPGLRPRVNPGFGFEKPAGYPGLRGPGATGLDALTLSSGESGSVAFASIPRCV